MTTEGLLGAVFPAGSVSRLYSEDSRAAELISVKGWPFSRALQGRLRRDGAIFEFTVDKRSVERYSADSNEVSIEAGESSLLRSVTRKRLVKAN
jgi:hypothetical protein